jgi:hypothetical protein
LSYQWTVTATHNCGLFLPTFFQQEVTRGRDCLSGHPSFSFADPWKNESIIATHGGFAKVLQIADNKKGPTFR